jgi:hypothetical protein
MSKFVRFATNSSARAMATGAFRGRLYSQRKFLGVAILLSLTGLATNVAAQGWRDALKKAKTEAQKTAASATGSARQAAGVTGQTGAPPFETWYMYCTVWIEKFAAVPWGQYYTDVFPYDHSQPKVALSAVSAWQSYIKEKYGPSAFTKGHATGTPGRRSAAARRAYER